MSFGKQFREQQWQLSERHTGGPKVYRQRKQVGSWLGQLCSGSGPRVLPNPGIKPASLALADRFFTTGKPH